MNYYSPENLKAHSNAMMTALHESNRRKQRVILLLCAALFFAIAAISYLWAANTLQP